MKGGYIERERVEGAGNLETDSFLLEANE